MQSPERVPIPQMELDADELGWSLERVTQERDALIDQIASALEGEETPETIEWVVKTLRGDGDGSAVVMTGSDEVSQMFARFYVLDARLEGLAER